jgi:hypothetical protein
MIFPKRSGQVLAKQFKGGISFAWGRAWQCPTWLVIFTFDLGISDFMNNTARFASLKSIALNRLKTYA